MGLLIVRLSNSPIGGGRAPRSPPRWTCPPPTIGYHKRRARERGDLVVRLPLPEPAPAPAPRTLTIQLPPGVQVEVVQDAPPVAQAAFAT